MRYIERILQPGEKLLYAGKIHWIVYFPTIILALIALAALTRANNDPIGKVWWAVAIACGLAALVMFLPNWLKRWTTEIDVTDRRIVYKRGLIKRHTVEMNMDKVESVDVDQSVLGRLLNYGDITIVGTGESIEPLRTIGAPLDFRNHVTAR